MRGTRRHSVAVGLLICLPVLLFGALPALALQLTDPRRSEDPTSERLLRADTTQVGWETPVRVSGDLRTLLTPGRAVPIRLRFDNPNPRTVILRRVRTRIARIVAPQADATHRCTRRDFRVEQMSLRTLRLPAGKTDLTDLAVPVWDWPRLKLRNRPVNQDGCKGARVTLRYRTYRGPWS